jgi:hypothetical protein
MLSYAERAGLSTLGDLATLSEARLFTVPKIGRLTIHRTFLAIARLAGADVSGLPSAELPRAHDAATLGSVDVARPPPTKLTHASKAAPAPPPPGAAHRPDSAGPFGAKRGLLEAWEARIARLPPQEGRSMRLHAGLDGGPRRKHAEVGVLMGLTGSMAGRLERVAVDRLGQDQVWLEMVRARFARVLHAPKVPLSMLEGSPWWSGIVHLSGALDYFGERVLGGASVVNLDGELHLARWAQREG